VLPIVVNFVDSKYKIKNPSSYLLAKRDDLIICCGISWTVVSV